MRLNAMVTNRSATVQFHGSAICKKLYFYRTVVSAAVHSTQAPNGRRKAVRLFNTVDDVLLLVN